MILIAVDSRTIRTQIERLCERDGLNSITAASLAEARTALAENPIQLVVLDEWFPDGSGSELLEEIRRAGGDHLPIISIAAAGALSSKGKGASSQSSNASSQSSNAGSENQSASSENQGASSEDQSAASQDQGAGSEPSQPHTQEPDSRIPKARLVGELIDQIRLQLRAHAPERSLGRILLIDDSITYREQLRLSLEAAGYTVAIAQTGEEGVRMAFDHPPDAMLVDSMLPGISGAQVIRRIRSESATRRTPCCLLTASEDPEQELEALDAGADTFVRKDEELAVVLARLAGILRSASTPAAASLAALPQLPRRVVLIGLKPGPLDSVGVVLLEEGCETVSVGSAQVSVARCALLDPDIVVYAAPVNDAMLAFCREFKNLPALRNSRLLLLDSADSQNIAVKALQAGADDYLPAASDHHIILARAKSQLRRKRMEDENRGLREHMIRQELETEAQRALADARSRHAEEMRVAYALAERKAHEAERARMELEQITEGIPQIVWTSAADGRAPRFNRRWTDYTGLPHQDVTSSIWRRAIHREDLARAFGDWVTSFRGGLPYTSEYRLRAAAGDFRWFLVRAIPLSDEHGQIDRWFGTCTDIHEQRLSEEALRRTEKLAATGRLAASIAHEINNPLESVTNLLYLIEQTTRQDPDTHEFTLTAQKELDRVAQISKKTLAFYRESTDTAAVDLCGLVDEVVDIYSVRLERKHIQLQLELDCERRPQGIAGELRQVISNLVTNAIDASAMNSNIRIRVREAHAWKDTPVEGVRISIGDHGHGIPRELQTDIYKPFITTKGQKGTGLGLWLSHSIISRHGGRLALRSATGERHGTCFSFFLPTRLLARPAESDSMGSMMRTIGKELLGQ